MAADWIKSLNCKTKVLDEVVSSHHHYCLLRNSGSCKNRVRSIRDVVNSAQERRPRNSKPSKPALPPPDPPENLRPVSKNSGPGSGPGFDQPIQDPENFWTGTARHSRAMSEPYFPALTELPEGHPSRNVVEIIFHTSWSPKSFPGRVEVMFKVQNLTRTVTRFEEYRETVKNRASGGEDRARCVADGNEVMRFYCLGPTSGGGAYETGGACGAWSLHPCKGTAAICTFSGSSDAHESGGGGRGRRAMLVCRVIAGRVGTRFGKDPLLDERVGFDSVSGENGELYVFDSRAVLPCFLILYKL